MGGDADHNLGDAAILESLCRTLAASHPAAEITIVSDQRSPESWPGVATIVPRGLKGLRQLGVLARRQDLVIIGGGGLFQDDDSRAKMPYWALRTLALRATNPTIVGHCLGAGPLHHVESRVFARLACATMHSISARDRLAQQCLQRCTRRSIDLVPDPAFMLPPAPEWIGRQVIATAGLPEGPVLGVVLRGWFHRRGGLIPRKVLYRLGVGRRTGAAPRARLQDELTAALSVLARRQGASILLLPSYLVPHEGDLQICRDLATRLGQDGVKVGIATLRSPAEYKTVTGRLSLLISARMHPLIFASAMGVPIVGLAYNDKFAGLFELLGLPARMIWLDEFASAPQASRLVALATEALEDHTDLRRQAGALADAVTARTASLLSLRPAVCESRA